MKKRKIKIWIILLICALLITSYSLYEPFCLEIKEYDILSNDIPEAFIDAKIAFLSDIHYGDMVKTEWVEHIVEQTNSLNPDIILLGGDYITGDEALLDEVFSILGKLKPAYGTFSVIGNHEWPYDRHYASAAIKNNITPVDKKLSRVFIGKDSLVIAGSEFYLSKMPDEKDLNTRSSEKDFVMYLQHNPDYAEVSDNPRIDVMLSGHTHGGQVTLFGAFAPYLPTKTGQKYRSGRVDNSAFPVIVSNGLGVYKVPMRLGARPQIVVLNLKKN